MNLRVFTAGLAASSLAAERLLSLSVGEQAAWTVVIDSVGPEAASDAGEAARKAGVTPHYRAPRLALCGSPASLLELARALLRQSRTERLAADLQAAVTAYHTRLHSSAKTLVMGILNVTPDSFSDGGLWVDTGRAVEHGLRMVEDGADVIDVGGESTRPGAEEVPAEEEVRRVLPVVQRLAAETNTPISIDTRNAGVAAACLEAGATWVNDVSGLIHDPQIASEVARRAGTRLVLMHSLVKPAEEKYSTEYPVSDRPAYEDVVADTMRWLRRQAELALERGVPAESLWIDPGFGFGKSFEQNVEILRRLREYTSTGLPVLVGTSRKSTVGRLVGDLPPTERLEGTAATISAAILHGAAAVRVHDVKEMARVARATDALR